MINELFF